MQRNEWQMKATHTQLKQKRCTAHCSHDDEEFSFNGPNEILKNFASKSCSAQQQQRQQRYEYSAYTNQMKYPFYSPLKRWHNGFACRACSAIVCHYCIISALLLLVIAAYLSFVIHKQLPKNGNNTEKLE